MRYAVAALFRNLLAGARLTLFLPVERGSFRVDLLQWVLAAVFSAVLDIALDGLRATPDAHWSSLGVNGELFALGLLMLSSGVLAALFRDREAFLALPIVVLTSFPLLQVIHAAPAVIGIAWPPGWNALFELALVVWSVVMCMRAVRVVSDTPVRRRLLRAIGGGLLLSMPLWFSPLAGPLDRWWMTQAADDEGPSPASEPVMAAQAFLLDRALEDLEDSRPGVTDLYFVGFAPDSRRDGFRDELESAQHVLDERFGTHDRSVLLVNHRTTVAEMPFATLTNLRRVLQEIGDAIDPDEDVVMLYLTAGATEEHGLAAVHPPLDLVALTPQGLKQLLDAAEIRYRVIVVSTCAGGAWLDALRDDDTAVLVSTPGTGHPAGCDGGPQPSEFSRALFDRALRKADTLPQAFDLAIQDLAAAGVPAPQVEVGPGIRSQLERVRRGATVRSAALSPVPPR